MGNSRAVCGKIAQKLLDTIFVVVGDRENDFFEYYLEFKKLKRALKNLHFLIRIKNNRKVEGEELRLYQLLEQLTEAGQIKIEVPVRHEGVCLMGLQQPPSQVSRLARNKPSVHDSNVHVRSLGQHRVTELMRCNEVLQ